MYGNILSQITQFLTPDVIAKLAPTKHRREAYVVSDGKRPLWRGRSIDDVLRALEQALEPA